MSEFSKPLKLVCPIQHYAWGRPASESIIASLQAAELSESDRSKPCAELWIGAHPSSPSTVDWSGQERSLDDLIDSSPQEMLGDRVARKFGGSLPFLLKVLSIARPLSIQAHPDKQLAAVLHKQDPKHYPDSNHKPEIALALTEVELLAGFRPLAEILRVIRADAGLSELLSAALPDANETQKLQQLYAELMRAGEAKLKTAAEKIAAKLRQEKNLSAEDKWFLRLQPEYPHGDAGLFCFYFLQYRKLSPGECVFTGAGVPHAYLSGELVECMANSDNVVRAGLTPKYKDVETLLQMLSFESKPLELLQPERKSAGLNILSFRPPVTEFVLEKLSGSNLNAPHLIERNGIELLLCLEGAGTIRADNSDLPLQPGDAYVIPAACNHVEIALHSGVLFRAFVP